MIAQFHYQNRLIIFIVVFSSISWQSFGQLPERDSIDYLMKERNYTEALSKVNKLLLNIPAEDTARRDLLFIKGICFENRFEYDSALNNYLGLLKSYPDYGPAIIEVAAMYGEKEEYKKAYHFLNKLKKLPDFRPLCFSNLTYYKGLEGNYSEAISYADTTLTIAQDSIVIALALNNRGFAQLKLNHLELALKDVNESLKLYPRNSFAYRNKALIYIEQQRIPEACKALYKANSLGGIQMTKELIEKYCH